MGDSMNLTAEDQVQNQATLSGIYGRKSGTEKGFSPNISVRPVIIPPKIHTHSSITDAVSTQQ
jgi:hypothetical protein